MSKIEHAVYLIERYSDLGGIHHKQWLLDQLMRTLLEEKYEGWVESYKEKGHCWDEGIAP
jgi:hypothetical protein